MKRMLALAAAFALVLAACGGDDDDNTSAQNTSATTTASTTSKSTADATPSSEAGQQKDVTVAYGETSLGDTLVDGMGKTLYVFENDADGKSTCNGACASTWPPLMVTGDPVLGDGLDKSLFTVITRDDGTKQVAVAGQPLYTYAPDTKAGDVNGQGVGNLWYAAGIDGSKLGEADESPTTAAQSSSGLGGY